jgi:hypothetical protein
MIRRAEREIEINAKMFKEWDYCYDKQWKGKKREVKTALKDHKKRHDERKDAVDIVVARRNM